MRLNPGTIRAMKHSLVLPTLLIATFFSPLAPVAEAKSIQDTKRQGDFANRSAPAVSAEARRDMETRLEEALARYEANPNEPDAIIWLGRRLAYPGRFREAIDVYTKGIEKFPGEARLYRHRGHRYITLRRFALAIEDLKKAASLTKGKPDEVEPDGQPNARNIPTGTLQFNIWYHLGLAYYLTGDNKQALKSYGECLKVSNNPDALVATSHWLYMTLRRLSRGKEAARVLEPIRPGMDIIENDGYYRLLQMYQGLISANALHAEALNQGSSAGAYSILYGVGNWYSYNGRTAEASKVFQQILAGDQWTSFGYVAAEVDSKRLAAANSK